MTSIDGACESRLFIHLIFPSEDPGTKGGCKQADFDAVRDLFEKATKKLRGICPCPNGRTGPGCKISAGIQWHAEGGKAPGTPGGVKPLSVRVKCHRYNGGDFGQAAPDKDIWFITPSREVNPEWADEGLDSTAAHELGHVLFGTSDVPKEWGWDEEGHNNEDKDPDALMRKPATKGAKLSEVEACRLRERFGNLCSGYPEECCNDKKEEDPDTHAVAVLGGGLVGSTQRSGITAAFGIPTAGRLSARTVINEY